MQEKFIKILNSNIYGTVHKIEGKKITINHGNKKFITTIDNCIEISKEEYDKLFPCYLTKKVKSNTHGCNVTLTSKPETEIMIRHQTVLEAIPNVEKFIDTAVANKLDSVRIIHGKRGGVLRKAVHELLSTHPFVKSYSLADYFNGQYGVTVVYLKKN